MPPTTSDPNDVRLREPFIFYDTINFKGDAAGEHFYFGQKENVGFRQKSNIQSPGLLRSQESSCVDSLRIYRSFGALAQDWEFEGWLEFCIGDHGILHVPMALLLNEWLKLSAPIRVPPRQNVDLRIYAPGPGTMRLFLGGYSERYNRD